MMMDKVPAWLPPTQDRARRKLVRAADAARDRKDWREAARLYRQAIAKDAGRHDLRVQLGHMLKEAGDLQAADEAYQGALAAIPDSADLHLQIGHLRKLQGNRAGALRFYRRALELDPAHVDAARECRDLERSPPGRQPAEQEPDAQRSAAPGAHGISSLYALDDSHFTGKVASFDLFDTLIRRRYIAVNEVHDTVSAFVLAQLGQFGVESPGHVTLARYTTTDLLKTSPHIQNEEPSLPEIWTQFIGARIGQGERAAALAAQAAAFEYDIDAENLVAIDGAVELLTRLKACGKRVIAVSDMYYSAAQIDAILEQAGLRRFFDQVFVSCDIKATKQTGNLFRHVCRSLAVEPNEIVHVGDNLRSDIEVPRKLGMQAIHIDQPRMLGMERPPYGRRADIHEEVADLIKLFSFQMLFHARSNRADQVYFMSRDGCLINRALGRWQSPFVQSYFGDLPRADLFLSRATSCWLGTNFRDDWLLQSIGHAFWLHLGQATARQVSDILGIAEVPSTLDDRVYRSDTDTFVVLEAYVAAGLAPAIQASLMAKRSQVERYLRDAGFFGHKSVVICDVGYSGTVVRDLNTWFLQESVRPDHQEPPRIDFHVIASNGSYAANAVRATPHVTFNDRVVLPIQQMPQSLADSFAWLEVFFKHPTFGPLLGYAEQDGRMMPSFQVQPDPGDAHPSARILHRMPCRSADIVLLWMASIHFWGQLTSPLLDRFAYPDHATVAQMLDDVYEADAVTGRTRSVVLTAQGMSDEEIYQAAKAKDYWIAGSLVANRHAREMEAREAEAMPGSFAPANRSAESRLERFIRSFQGIERLTTGPLDTRFYRDFYDDLRVLPDDEALRVHYRLHGNREGRYRSGEHMRRTLTGLHGPLPRDFDHTAYLWANPDLVPHDPPRWHAEMHYLKTGRGEGRSYQPRLDELDDEFEELAAAGGLPLTAAEQTARADGVPLWRIVFQRHGIGPGPWLDALDLCEFGAINFTWCPRPATKAAAVEAFLRAGIDRLAPLSLTTWFDPGFYRQHAYGAEHLSDTGAYRHWLRDGCLLRRSPSEGHRLLGLIGVTEFPACLDWKAFLRGHAERFLARPSRSDVLEGFLTFGDPTEVGILKGEGAPSILEILGQRAGWRGQRDMARLAFDRALSLGGPAGRLWHKIGDLAFDEGDFQRAVSAYLKGIDSPVPDRWSYYKGVMAACEIKAFAIGFRFLDAGMETWKDMDPWRQAKARLLQAWYDTRQAQIYDGQGAEADKAFAAFIDDFADKIRSYMPQGLALSQPSGPVLVLTGGTFSDRTKAAFQGRPFESGTGRKVTVFSRPELPIFVESLAGASLAILHQVRCDADVIEAALMARAYGIRTVFWMGALGDFKAEGLALSDLDWNDFMLRATGLEADAALPSFYAALVCDSVVSTVPSLLPALEAVSASGRAAYAPRLQAPLPRSSLPRSSLPRSGDQGRIVILLHPPVREENVAALSDAALSHVLAALMEARPEVVVVTGTNLSFGRALSGFAGRVLLPSRHGPAGTIPLEGVVNLVVDLTGGQDGHHTHWATAAQAAIPCLMTRAGVLPWLTDGDVVVIEDQSELLSAVMRLVDDAELRGRIGAQAEARFTTRFAPALPVQPSQADRTSPADQTSQGGRARRILYANVFFPPQSAGGATRVLKDNIDHILATAASRYELAVFTSDDENSRRGTTRCDSYHGIPVFRIATPQEIDMDWRMHNAEVGLYARRVLDLFKPDLVHIHCLQRLSVAFAEACLAGGYPYVVTLHDAWWLSDFPFLIDEEGRVAPPQDRIIDQRYSPRIGFAASAQRAGRLRRALNGAQERLAVSEPFAALYRQAGFQVRTIANGVSPIEMPALTARPVQDRPQGRQRVRLGHIGGTQHHKGAYLIEAVLRSNSFDHLHFTLVELARDTGDETHTVWGSTPVTIIGKVLPHRVADLYGRLDVLLAPSTWPESYGLVSREAAACGLWVVASDQGAMGEIVVPEQNGFVIDVETPESLLGVLRRMDADPDRFTTPPHHQPVLRSSAEQSQELLALYDEMVGAEHAFAR